MESGGAVSLRLLRDHRNFSTARVVQAAGAAGAEALWWVCARYVEQGAGEEMKGAVAGACPAGSPGAWVRALHFILSGREPPEGFEQME